MLFLLWLLWSSLSFFIRRGLSLLWFTSTFDFGLCHFGVGFLKPFGPSSQRSTPMHWFSARIGCTTNTNKYKRSKHKKHKKNWRSDRCGYFAFMRTGPQNMYVRCRAVVIWPPFLFSFSAYFVLFGVCRLVVVFLHITYLYILFWSWERIENDDWYVWCVFSLGFFASCDIVNGSFFFLQLHSFHKPLSWFRFPLKVIHTPNAACWLAGCGERNAKINGDGNIAQHHKITLPLERQRRRAKRELKLLSVSCRNGQK